MSVRDQLANLISQQHVTWDDACRIADAILDEGWASPSEMDEARGEGYDEAIDFVVETFNDYSKSPEILRYKPLNKRQLQSAENALDGVKDVTYLSYNAHVESKWMGLFKEIVTDGQNPFAEEDQDEEDLDNDEYYPVDWSDDEE